MAVFTARIVEIGQARSGGRWARLLTPAQARPAPGQYLSAWAQEDAAAPLPEALFPAEIFPDGFRCAPAVPDNWAPGMLLQARGPLGHGFDFFNPGRAGNERTPRRLALAAMGDTTQRLLPLAALALSAGAGVAMFTDGDFPVLPALVEIYPLSELPAVLEWADALALDMTLAQFAEPPAYLGLPGGPRFPCPTQALIVTAMPCAGLGECGACAVQTPTGWVRLCEAGPVLSLA